MSRKVFTAKGIPLVEVEESSWTPRQKERYLSKLKGRKGNILTLHEPYKRSDNYKRDVTFYRVTCNLCIGDEFFVVSNSLPPHAKEVASPCSCGKGVPTEKRVGEIFKLNNTVLKCIDYQGDYLILSCSVCDKDEELWPTGSIRSRYNQLSDGKIPCGCAVTLRWTEDQYKVRVQRECEKRGYIFYGWIGNFKGNTTKLSLYNPVTKNSWQTTCIGNLFQGRGDPEEKGIKISQTKLVPDENHIEDFYKAGFSGGYKFWRSDKKAHNQTYWYHTCPACSSDSYVSAGLCSGVFESSGADLKNGKKACRCSKVYRWTGEQREYQLHNECERKGLTFVRWEASNGYTNNNSRFYWTCRKGHLCNSSVANFLNGKGCGTCFKELGFCNGYYLHRASEQDNLYIINFKKDKTIKVGRAFDVDERLQKQGKCLLSISNHTIEDVEILQVMTGTHQEVYDTEQWMHEELTDRGFHADWITWTSECFTEDSEDMIYRLLDESGLSESEW